MEIANITAYTRTVRQLVRNYSILPDGYSDILINVETLDETLDEVMTDKLVAFPASTKYIRYRDIWDLVWLKQQGASVNSALVSKKLLDYHIEDFCEKIQARVDSLPNIISGGDFHQEMKRFIPAPVYETSLAREGFSLFLQATLTELLVQLKSELYEGNDNPDLFIL
ncbi:nucleotidyl transferase AbiEii/AbiGii toxin family protein [Erwinia rhapontici]|uniref:nucleotidyl transferase AbiEii/AbiGii toxin family protein n=1 Tax=Erwinia rhapontici TaxID=55212 RepID=UPI003BA06A89